MSEKPVMLVLNGHHHILDKVTALAKTGPMISVDIKDINDFENFAPVAADKVNPEHVVTFENTPEGWSPESKEVIFYKQHEKMTILMGKEKVIAAGQSTPPGKPLMIKGRLISKPALKSVRFVDPATLQVAEQAAPPPVPERRYNPEFRNSPRFSDQRTENRYSPKQKYQR